MQKSASAIDSMHLLKMLSNRNLANTLKIFITMFMLSIVYQILIGS